MDLANPNCILRQLKYNVSIVNSEYLETQLATARNVQLAGWRKYLYFQGGGGGGGGEKNTSVNKYTQTVALT